LTTRSQKYCIRSEPQVLCRAKSQKEESSFLYATCGCFFRAVMSTNSVHASVFKSLLNSCFFVFTILQNTDGLNPSSGFSSGAAFIGIYPSHTSGLRLGIRNSPGSRSQPLLSPVFPRCGSAFSQSSSSRRARDQARLTRLLSCSSSADQDLLSCLVSKESSGSNIKKALEQGANANASDEWGRTALQIAAKAGRAEHARELLKAGADVHRSSTDSDSTTPLHTAALCGSGDLVALLLEFGADVAREDDFGCTAWHVAKEAGHTHLLGSLQVAWIVNHQ
jgi:hypothetical protein